MKGALIRSFAVAAVALMVGLVGDVVYVVLFCPPHLAWKRVQAGRTTVVLDHGYRYAVADESIYVCDVPHAIGPVVVHHDLDCVCAPEELGTAALGQMLNGTCAGEQRHPTRADEVGACRHAHCVDPIVPGLITP